MPGYEIQGNGMTKVSFLPDLVALGLSKTRRSDELFPANHNSETTLVTSVNSMNLMSCPVDQGNPSKTRSSCCFPLIGRPAPAIADTRTLYLFLL